MRSVDMRASICGLFGCDAERIVDHRVLAVAHGQRRLSV
jgi:hypothetical protein